MLLSRYDDHLLKKVLLHHDSLLLFNVQIRLRLMQLSGLLCLLNAFSAPRYLPGGGIALWLPTAMSI